VVDWWLVGGCVAPMGRLRRACERRSASAGRAPVVGPTGGRPEGAHDWRATAGGGRMAWPRENCDHFCTSAKFIWQRKSSEVTTVRSRGAIGQRFVLMRQYHLSNARVSSSSLDVSKSFFPFFAERKLMCTLKCIAATQCQSIGADAEPD
jgi:hypothetical protein